jgi:PST family polysaccharide transporter
MRETARTAPGDGSLRRRVARGTVINAGFLALVNSLGFVRGVVVAAFVSAGDYGVWGILSVGLATLLLFRQVGIGEKFIQQDEADQEQAFQKAMTLHLILAGLLVGAGVALIPAMAVAYGRSEIVVPGLLLMLALPAIALQTPLQVFYRRLEYGRQRALEAIDPAVSLVVTLALAALGFGYWSLVAGLLAGVWTAALAALAASPYPFAWRFERITARDYGAFSWPLVVQASLGMVMGHAILLVGEAELGLAAVGFITLAHVISQYATRVGDLMTNALYPAICAVRDRSELLLESFVKSNRVAVLWGFPFGLCLALFAADAIDFGLGREWRPAEPLLQAFGVTAAVRQIAFSWPAYYRALGRTRPIAAAAGIGFVCFFAVPLPLLVTDGLEGLALGMLLMEAVNVVVRAYFVRRLFGTLSWVADIARAAAPTLPAAVAVLLMRAAGSGPRSAQDALLELVLFAAAVAVLTLVLERRLLRELGGYLRAAPAA